jgi:Bin/amphiphysin/Rvs domain for vesicular trafficking
MTAPPSAKPQPKTFNHAIARASLSASHSLHTVEQGSSSGVEDPLATALEKYAIAEEKVGEARLAQDAAIQARFLAGWSTTLNTQIQFATRARRQVENARLSLDATKAKIKGGGLKFPGGQANRDGLGHHDETQYTEEQRAEIEAKEDEFIAQTEEAVGVMKNVSFQLNPLLRLRPSASRCKQRRLTLIDTITGSRHARAAPQSRRADRRTTRVPQEGLRDPVRASSGR